MKGVGRSNGVLFAVLIAAGCDQRPPSPGAISGVVRTTASSAPRRALPESVRRVCGDEAEDPTLMVSPGGGLANAVVWVTDAPPTSPDSAPAPVLDQRRCTYFPPVVVGHTGGKLKLRNSDPLFHNVRESHGAFNVGMPLEHQTVERALPAAEGPLTVVCDVHPWMRADVLVLPHDRWALTDAEGRFRLEGVAPGARPVKVWHPRLQGAAQTVQVTAGAEAKLDVTLEP